MASRARTRAVEREHFRVYWRRAEELRRAMSHAYENHDVLAAGVNGVQCAIAVVDAVTVAYRGVVSAGPSHEDAVKLLEGSEAAGAADRAGSFRRVVELKFLLEYDDRPATDEEVADLVKRVVRLHRWAAGVLPPR